MSRPLFHFCNLWWLLLFCSFPSRSHSQRERHEQQQQLEEEEEDNENLYDCFENNNTELRSAVKIYVRNPADRNSSTALRYGWPMGTWCVGSVTNFSAAFAFLSTEPIFEEDLSEWDTSSATTTRGMFQSSPDLNPNIRGWNVSGVTDMNRMFLGAQSFNSDISAWDVSNVRDMGHTFAGALEFRQDLSHWRVSRVTDMTRTFALFHLDFDDDTTPCMMGIGNIGGSWDVSRVTSMREMFDMDTFFFRAKDEDEDEDCSLSSWDVSRATDLSGMFRMTSHFDQDLSSWNVSNVLDASYLFEDAWSFDQNLCAWREKLPHDALVKEMLLGTNCDFDSSDPVLDNETAPFCHQCNTVVEEEESSVESARERALSYSIWIVAAAFVLTAIVLVFSFLCEGQMRWFGDNEYQRCSVRQTASTAVVPTTFRYTLAKNPPPATREEPKSDVAKEDDARDLLGSDESSEIQGHEETQGK